VLLTAAFLKATRTWPADRRVLHISSGLGRRAMAGSAVYCAVKAGMDHHARSVALDEAHRAATGRGTAARIVSLAPGVIDTDMQKQLRGADPAAFAHQETFAQLHDRGQLTSPDDAARAVLAFLWRADFGATPVADVRES
jgi:NAD(P)-dependent dehydrogenase (short-subunit alcohol dehydrogenase family)